MSNLGQKILYSAVNAHEKLWAERFYAPEHEFEEILRNEAEMLRSHESHDPLCRFDIVGFSIPTELCFTAILTIIELGGVPLLRDDRSDADPIVIGGGPSVYNPEPLTDFFDLFVLGEAEELLPEICLKVGAYKKENLGREEILTRLAKLEGVYVPSLFEITYDGAVVKEISAKVKGIPSPKRIFIDDLNDSPYPFEPVIPYGQPVFDRLSIEIDRGCTMGCRYCQAGITYRPVRERDPKEVVAIAEKGLKSTGFDNLSLASLSSGDYGPIGPVVKSLMDATQKEHIALSLPSLRSGTLTEELISEIARVRKTGFTITAEAGNERLRWVINKNVTNDEILETARIVLAGGWKLLKLYFMIGLPTETDEDVESILDLVKEISRLKENGKRFVGINVGVAQFVPKPHTPFQWFAMDSVEELLRKKTILYRGLNRIGPASLKGHDVEMSFLEGVFSRGDRRLGEVILKAYRKGCRLDGWNDYFKFDSWMESFSEAGIRPEDYANREREHDEILPWDHIDVGVTKKYLLRELAYADKGEVTLDCRHDKCQGCGLHKDMKILASIKEIDETKETVKVKANNEAETFRYRIIFTKRGVSRYLSHLEMKTALTRGLRRSGLLLAHSLGFHPHPKIGFGPALSLGIESNCEIIDVQLKQHEQPEVIKERMRGRLEKGIEILEVAKLEPPFTSIQSEIKSVDYEIMVLESDEGIYEQLYTVLTEMEGVMLANGSEKGRLKFNSKHLGILSRMKEVLPGFELGLGIKMIKTAVHLEKPRKKVKVS
jgi:radical SAM family uncharacterized protein/radical SAM-linked protein